MSCVSGIKKQPIRDNSVRSLVYKSSLMVKLKPWEESSSNPVAALCATTSTTSMFASITNAASILEQEENSSTADSSSMVDEVYFESGSCMIPHPDKVYKGGEDAYFVSKDKTVMGVFDGVGAWSNIGIDPGLYSKSLASECNEAYEQLKTKDPLDLLERAWLKSQHIRGSSTACCVVLSGKKLKAANLGDSGFLIIRRTGQLIYYQAEQQHSFNFPFQLGTGSTDEPQDADLSEVEVEHGDVVVVATDGVLDNLFPEELVQIVKEGKIMRKSEKEIASRIAKIAFKKAKSEEGKTPFSVSANAAGHVYSGGKLDDISVICATVMFK